MLTVMPTVDRLPPFAALRVFEAAARNPNFSAAAAELHVTPGAVSRQIAELEGRLGVALFVRGARRAHLTDAGAQFAERLRVAFGLLREAVRGVERADEGRVVVALLPSFASRWLLPRLPAFSEANPGIDVDLRPSRDVVELERNGIDLAIRYGRGRWPGTASAKLLGERVFPVCTPGLARRHRPRTLEDVLAMPLIHDLDFPWSLLLAHRGMRVPRRLPGIRVDDSSIALQAAERGQGVLLARSVLVAESIAAGRLVRLLRVSAPCEFAYYVAWPRGRVLTPAAEAFRNWLYAAAG